MDINKVVYDIMRSMGFKCSHENNIIICKPYDYFEEQSLKIVINKIESSSFNRNLYTINIKNNDNKSVSNIINFTDEQSLRNIILAMIKILEEY